MIKYSFGIASQYRECLDGIQCMCGWGKMDSDGVETCQDKPQNCMFWSEDAEDLRDAEETHEDYLQGRQFKPYGDLR